MHALSLHACTHGVQTETLEDVCLRKYCMHTWPILNAYMLTLCPIYEKITEEVSSPGAHDVPCMLMDKHINN